MPEMFETRVDLDKKTRDEVIDLLNQSLADSFDLYSQTKQAHWNVKGMEFIQLHELFDMLAGEVLGYVDMIAERVTALGGAAMGTARMAAKASKLPEYPEAEHEGKKVVTALAERYGAFSNSARAAADACEDLGDMGTNDLFIEIVRGADKSLYFLESHLQA